MSDIDEVMNNDPVRHFRRDGSPCSLEEWLQLHGDPSYWLIADTSVTCSSSRQRVVTAWLGNDMGWDVLGLVPEDGRPRIFGSLTFPGHDEFRYATEQEAREGHERIVRALSGMP